MLRPRYRLRGGCQHPPAAPRPVHEQRLRWWFAFILMSRCPARCWRGQWSDGAWKASARNAGAVQLGQGLPCPRSCCPGGQGCLWHRQGLCFRAALSGAWLEDALLKMSFFHYSVNNAALPL